MSGDQVSCYFIILYFSSIKNRRFSTWLISHFIKQNYISLEDDVPVEGDELPQGSTPIWIDVTRHTTQREILTALQRLTSGRSVTVLHDDGKKETEAEDYCRTKKWNYRDNLEMYGCEDEVIIAIDCLVPETITRPHNLLVMVTTPGAE